MSADVNSTIAYNNGICVNNVTYRKFDSIQPNTTFDKGRITGAE